MTRFTDYFRYPGVQFFESIPDLLRQLVRLSDQDLAGISGEMRKFNEQTLVQSARRWQGMVQRASPDRYDAARLPEY